MERQLIQMLIRQVEQRTGGPLLTPKDFERLKTMLPQHDQLSISTLKRIWAYVPNSHLPREVTLSILARFVGFDDWNDFCRHHASMKDSDFLADTVKTADLKTGEEIMLEWVPDRSCRLRKQAEGCLLVVAACNCKLQVGDTFHTAWLSVGQPLCATHVIRNGLSLPDYIAGRKAGLTKVIVLRG